MGILGIDFGGTQIRGGWVEHETLVKTVSEWTPSSGSESEVLNAIFGLIDQFDVKAVEAIGIGVPSVVDIEKGIVYDVQNIPALKEFHLKKLLEDKYRIPVLVNNDANCFVLGEKYFGKGKGRDNMVGLTLGTGLGGGIIIHNHLYAGANCGAGEFGMVPYLKKHYERYASGQFFKYICGVNGQQAYEKALAGDEEALSQFAQFGEHLGKVLHLVLYTYDPEFIVLGGSISRAFDLFEEAMMKSLKSFAYTQSLTRLNIVVSELDHVGVLGAAALWYDKK